jgi:hypothetical protein
MEVPVIGYPMATPDQLAERVELVEESGVRALGHPGCHPADARTTVRREGEGGRFGKR